MRRARLPEAGTAPEAVRNGQREPDLRPREPSNEELGRRIRILRVTRGLTLKELEQRGGISATHVSEIERGHASPTIGALGRIARALGVRPAYLVEPSVLPPVAWSRAGGNGRCARIGGAELQPLGGAVPRAAIGAHLLRLPAREPGTAHRHGGEEWVTVLEGAVEARIEGRAWLLRAGDSLHFHAHREHAYANRTPAPAVLLVVHHPRPALHDSI